MTLYMGDGHLTAPSWRPGGGVIVFAERTAPLTNQLRVLLLGDPRVVKPLIENEDLFASRAAWLSNAEFVYTADGQLWRRALAHPTRQPVHLFAAVAVNAFSPPSDLRPLDERGARPVFGIAGALRTRPRRPKAVNPRRAQWRGARPDPAPLTNQP